MLMSSREVPSRRSRASMRRRAPTVTLLVSWALLLLVPSVVTVLRYSADFLNADGVEQSVMSIQGPRLFYWGQDRLFPAISWVASPVADPTANLWLCFVLQALALHGLLLYLAVRATGVLRSTSPGAHNSRGITVLTYLVLVATANALWAPAMMQSFATEGQPYALSWLLTALSFEAWRTSTWPGRVGATASAFVALGINPSVVLIAGFLALIQVLRTRQALRWALFLGVLGGLFVGWSLLSNHFAMYPTPARAEAQSYLSFSFDVFADGFRQSINNVVGHHRPIRTLVALLAALAALVLINDALRARLVFLGSFFAGFTLLYVALFAGNEWVEMNGFNFRYFFPLQLLIVLATALPVTGAIIQVWARLRSAKTGTWSRMPSGLPIGLALAGTALAFAGPLKLPQDAPILTRDDATEQYARAHDITFISGNYWNMWPLMHGLLDGGRDAVLVAGFKAEGDPDHYRQVLDQDVQDRGTARALCVNEDVVTCANYLDYWTRLGWRPVRGPGAECPVAPNPDPEGPPPACRLMTYKPKG